MSLKKLVVGLGVIGVAAYLVKKGSCCTEEKTYQPQESGPVTE